jgi:tripartite-type tricarboxylate transporter receptor subunit TctC
VVRKLSAAVVEVLRQPETRQRLFTAGWQAVGTSPEGLKLRVEQEAKAMSGIIATRGIKLD